MREILIACGDVETLKKIIGELPPNQYKPIATKRGGGIAQKIAGRGVLEAIVHEQLADGGAGQLLQELTRLSPPPRTLLLTSSAPPKQGPFEVALKYPVPGPVLRNAIKKLAPDGDDAHDLEQWRTFYRELKARTTALASSDYYAVLGVPRDAPHHQLVTAFDAASLRYHPDRYSQFRSERWGEAIYQEANTFYKVVTEAYGVLSERKTRTLYDKALASGQLRLSTDEASNAKKSGPQSIVELGQSQMSKKFLKLAQTDIAAQNWSSALQNLKFAASMEPGNQAIQAKISEIQAKIG